MPRRKRLLIVLIFLVAVAGPVIFFVARPRPTPVAPQPAPVQPPPEPVVEPPPPPPPPPPPEPPPPPVPQPDPAAVEAERRAKQRADGRAAFERGLALQRKGDFAGAATAYKQAVELDAELAGAWTNMGLAFAKLGKHEEGLQYAQRALALPAMSDPARRANAQYVVGFVAEGAGAADLARAAYADALKAKPGLAPAALALSNLQVEAEQSPAALATLLAAREAGADTAAVDTNIAALYLEAREPAKAVEYAQMALRGSPDLPEAKLALGYAQLALQRWSDAAQNLDEAARDDRGNADLQVALGYAYEKLGRRQDALAAFDRALILRGNHTEALQNRAVTLERMGESGPAQQAYERAMAARGPNAGSGATPSGTAPSGATPSGTAPSGAAPGGAGGSPKPSPNAAQLQLAVIAARKKDWPEARRLAEPIVAAEPGNAQARYVLGLACFYTNDRKCAADQEYELTLLDAERATALRKLISQH